MIKNTAKRIISLVAAALIVSLALVSCAKKYDFPESTDKEKETVLRLGDEDIPFELYRAIFMKYKYEEDGGSDAYWNNADADAAFERLDKQTREELLRYYAALRLALDYGIDYHSGQIQKYVLDTINDEIENDFGGLDEYLAALDAAYMNHSVYSFLRAEMRCEELLYSALVEDGTVKTDDETIMSAILGGEFCHAKQILIKNDPGDDIEKNRQTAEDILTQLQLGADFDTLVAKYGEDMEMVTRPMGYYFTHGEMIEEFEEAAFALKIGERSGIIETDIGYHIILRCEIDRAYVSGYYDELASSYLTSQYTMKVWEKESGLAFVETEFSRSLSMSDFSYSESN